MIFDKPEDLSDSQKIARWFRLCNSADGLGLFLKCVNFEFIIEVMDSERKFTSLQDVEMFIEGVRALKIGLAIKGERGGK